jgi:hypothetical protein
MVYLLKLISSRAQSFSLAKVTRNLDSLLISKKEKIFVEFFITHNSIKKVEFSYFSQVAFS